MLALLGDGERTNREIGFPALDVLDNRVRRGRNILGFDIQLVADEVAHGDIIADNLAFAVYIRHRLNVIFNGNLHRSVFTR